MFTTQEIYNMDVKGILQELEKARKQYNENRIHIITRNAKKTSETRKEKKYIARLLTILTQKIAATSTAN